LDVSDNRIRIEQLANLTNLVELYIQFNQIDSLNIAEGMFPQLEKLHLSYNNIPANNLVNLAHLRKLTLLDIASNDLVTLPDTLEFLESVEELNLSSNQFSSDSTLVKPSKLFYSMGTMPQLKRLNLSRNKFSAFHYEDLNENSFRVLQELDFSYNLVEDQNEMMYCQNLKNLLTLTITGNPFAQRGKDEYVDLEHILSSALSAVVINRTEFSSKLAKRLRLRGNDEMKALPYPKPVTLLSREIVKYDEDNKKGKSKIKQELFDAELNKGIALPISDIRPTTNQEDEIFPKQTNGKDVFTPPIEAEKPEVKEQDENNFFITGDGAEEIPGRKHEPMQDSKNVIKELHSQESGDEEDPNQEIHDAERAIQDRNMFDEDLQQENIDFGKAKMDEFKSKCMDLLLNDNETEYETPLDLPGAYKVLKGLIKNPVIVHSKRPNKGYMKQTFATSRHAVAVKGDEQRFLEYSKLSKQSKHESQSKLQQDDDLKLPPILALKNDEGEYREPSLLEKLEGFAGKPAQKLSKKQEKINKKVEALLEADRRRQRDESMADGDNSGKKDPKKALREKYGFSDSDEY
jgi:hypothetical protein